MRMSAKPGSITNKAAWKRPCRSASERMHVIVVAGAGFGNYQHGGFACNSRHPAELVRHRTSTIVWRNPLPALPRKPSAEIGGSPSEPDAVLVSKHGDAQMQRLRCGPDRLNGSLPDMLRADLHSIRDRCPARPTRHVRHHSRCTRRASTGERPGCALVGPSRNGPKQSDREQKG